MNPVKQFRDRLGDLTRLLDDSTLTRAIYSSDASLYRVPPLLVAYPEDRDQLIAVARAALACRLPVTVRGAGTSCAGNAVGEGLVIDVAKHLNHIPVTPWAEARPRPVHLVEVHRRRDDREQRLWTAGAGLWPHV